MPWKVDPAHSSVNFGARHMLVATTRGKFNDYSVNATVDEDDLSKSSAEVTIKAASVDTNEPKRDAHLRSADFFDAERFPDITFKSKRLEPKGDEDVRLVGDLTVKDVTREVTLDGEWSKPQADPFGVQRTGISVEGKVSRKDFGLNWSAPVEMGGIVVGDTIKLMVDLELVKEA
ncbi:MAG: YceI family protein [Tepidiformaceae bacterium]